MALSSISRCCAKRSTSAIVFSSCFLARAALPDMMATTVTPRVLSRSKGVRRFVQSHKQGKAVAPGCHCDAAEQSQRRGAGATVCLLCARATPGRRARASCLSGEKQ